MTYVTFGVTIATSTTTVPSTITPFTTTTAAAAVVSAVIIDFIAFLVLVLQSKRGRMTLEREDLSPSASDATVARDNNGAMESFALVAKKVAIGKEFTATTSAAIIITIATVNMVTLSGVYIT